MQFDDQSAEAVLSHFRDMPRGTLIPLGHHGGFSGARLWRLATTQGDYCVKAHPAGRRCGADLAWIHSLLDRAAHLSWLPRVCLAADRTSFVETQERLWEITTWLPGVADFGQAPSPERLRNAMIALAQLHNAWQYEHRQGVCPAVRRRMDAWSSWSQLLQTGWRPMFAPPDAYRDRAEPLLHFLQRNADDVPRILARWRNHPVSLQPCVCDVWHDHVLFTGDEVTGMVDFGSVKVDHVAVDLARLLGSLVGDDAAMWEDGLAAYSAVRSLAPWERELARDLDRTGVWVAASHWLRWLYHEGRVYSQLAAVRARLDALLQRLVS